MRGALDAPPSDPPVTTPDAGGLLRSGAAAAEVAERGFTLAPLIGPEEVARLLSVAADLRGPDGPALDIDYTSVDRSRMRLLREVVGPMLEPHLRTLLHPFTIALATFVTKRPDPDSEMFLHDDRTFVDERIHRSLSLWVPLHDVGPDTANGGLEVIPRSHHLPTGWSGSNTPDLFRPHDHRLRSLSVPLTLSAGEVAIYDSRLLHSSPANRSRGPRAALVVTVVPAGADLVHVVATDARRRLLHRVDPDFFLDIHPRRAEEGLDPARYPVIDEVVGRSPLTEDEIDTALGVHLDGTAVAHVPWDLQAGLADHERPPLPRTRRTLAHHPSDPDPTDLSRSLPAASVPTARRICDLRLVEGTATVHPLRRGRVSRRVPAKVPLPPGRPTRGRILLVLDPGARVAIRGRENARGEMTVTAVDCPPIGSGLLVGSAAGCFEPGDGFAIGRSEGALLWNDGPGECTLLIESRPPGRQPR